VSPLQRVLSPEYWAVSNPGLPGRLWYVYAAIGLAFLAGIVFASRSVWMTYRQMARDESHPGPPSARTAYGWFELAVSLAGLLSIVGRFLGWPGWSARIWPPFLAALALSGFCLHQARRRSIPTWLSEQLRILALLPARENLRFSEPPAATEGRSAARRQGCARSAGLAVGIALHVAGTAFVLKTRFGLPEWLAPAVLALLAIPQLRGLLEGNRISLRALTPLIGGYLVALATAAYHSMGITVVGWQGRSFPNPMTSFFYLDGILLACAAYSILCQLYASQATYPPVGPDGWAQRRLPALRAWQWVVLLGMLLTSAWAVATYLGKRTHGATGSDPYAYAQMAVDLANRGTLLHRFSLFPEVRPLGIAWGPLFPVGYHLPVGPLGDAATVWATGASVLLAAGYRLFGEAGLYVTTPVTALVALFATALLALEVLRDEPRPVRFAAAALTVALTATSPEHVDRLLVPMADAAAQLFTILTILFCLRAMRRLEQEPGRAALELVLGGVSFAWCYWVRHTQLVLLLPISLGLWLSSAALKPRLPGHARRVFTPIGRLWPLALFSASALLMAIPDTLYRWRVFGGMFATETTELPAMALRNIGPVSIQALREALVAAEWGYLFPFALVGSLALVRVNRRSLVVLALAVGSVLLVHLTYRFLRLRDLLSLFPLVNLFVGYGAVSLIRSARAYSTHSQQPLRLGPAALSPIAIAATMLALAMARWTMIDDAFRPGWASFGYVRPDQRAAFDRLAELTPPGSVIGASLNAGAVTMYSGRQSIRPYESWSDDDWRAFVDAMSSNSRSIYLLDDGDLMADFVMRQRGTFRLVPIEPLAIPLFGASGREVGWLYELVKREPAN